MAKNYLRFWGVRGSYPAPFRTHMGHGGNTCCIEIRVGDQITIVDAGTGIIPLGNELLAQDHIRELSIILSHYHWDHISGLPFFMPAFTPGWKVNFFGPGDTQEVEYHLSNQMKSPYFPVEIETWLAKVEFIDSGGANPIKIGPLTVEYFYLHHPGITFGYRIKVGKKTIVYASDNELAYIDRAIDERKAEFDEPEQHLLEQMRKEERDRAIEFMRGADILIHDAQYTPADYERKRGWGHSCYIDTVNCAIDAGVKKLFLFSLDPNYPDPELDELHTAALAMVAERKAKIQCEMSREGVVLDLG